MKIQKSIIFSLFFIISSCNSKDNNRILIDNFIKEVIIKNNKNHEDWSEYIQFSDNLEKSKKKQLTAIIQLRINHLNNQLKENNQFSIVKYKDSFNKKYNLNFKYSGDYSKVYFIICNSRPITPIIVENDKIVCFFYGISKSRKNSQPWLLNKEVIF